MYIKMIFSYDQILNLLIAYRYFIIFPIAMIEGPTISIIAGFLVSTRHLNFLIVYPMLILADLAGDTMYYAIGRFGGIFFLKRWGRFLGINSDSVFELEQKFKRNEIKLLFFGKTQAIGSAILAAAGLIKMPYPRFLWINLFATIIKSFILIVIGYYFGRAYIAIDNYIMKAGIISALIVVAIIIIYIMRRRKNP